MIYMVVAVIILLAYIIYLQMMWRKTQKNLKELIIENDKHTTVTNATDEGDIYFKTNLDFNISYANEATSKKTGFKNEELVGHPLLGTLIDNSEGNLEKLQENLDQLIKKQATLNIEGVLHKKDGSTILMRCRKRPILNEVLKCTGISYLCQDISETKVWKQKLSTYTSHDFLIGNILNEEAFIKRQEHSFNRAKRYNTPFSIVVIELKDIYEFANKGIDFETGDKILKSTAELCVKEFGKNYYIGRFDKTKIGIIFNKTERDEAAKNAERLYKMIIAQIRSLNIDESNATMIAISYTDRRSLNDTGDTMLERVRRHIARALQTRSYGIKSSDKKIS